ncbi:putative transcriptional regulator [Candidatus Desulfosporosinus infrequens]|uniref:Putative transcriptional regulator n=1 Tax=Candidatus Desulfosporosinus infrequens TaxID=2043169 RepID=A0A2U3KLV3_9FIRM|nr:putative transcriptional regulator [Candidatus Desulfosporosinus infrequens]
MGIINNRVSMNVKHFRKLKGLTQERLAEKVEVSPVYISYLECGSKVPSLVLLAKIADALEIDPALLFIQDDDPTNLEIKNLVGTVSGLEKSTIQFINEMIIAFLNFKNSTHDS